MGDRANIFVGDDKKRSGVYLYSHWYGSDLPELLQGVIKRGERLNDPPYLARIIFCKMVEGNETESTGYGISATPTDGERRTLVVDCDKSTVSFDELTVTFDDIASGAVSLPDKCAEYGW